MRFPIVVLILAVSASSGCVSNKLASHVAPQHQQTKTPVSSIGIVGDGSSAASAAFQQAGYRLIDLGLSTDPMVRARSENIPFVATVSPVGTEGSWWDGMFDFAMRVSESQGGTIVYSATAEYGQGGVTINQTKSGQSAMRDMVADFAVSFPPSGGLNPEWIEEVAKREKKMNRRHRKSIR